MIIQLKRKIISFNSELMELFLIRHKTKYTKFKLPNEIKYNSIYYFYNSFFLNFHLLHSLVVEKLKCSIYTFF